MNWIDYAIIAIIGISALAGLMRGFVREVVSLLVWCVALWVAWQHFRGVAIYLRPWVESQAVRFALAGTAVFLVVLSLGGLVGIMIGILMDKTGLSSIDQLLGIMFGTVRGLLLVIILVLLGGITTLPRESWWHDSRLLPSMQQIAVNLVQLLPQEVGRYFRY